MLSTTATSQTTRYYTGPGYEKNLGPTPTQDIHYIDAPAGLIAIVVRENGVDTYHYVYGDHLGSILTVTNSSGAVEAEQNFDAWGRRRNPTDWSYNALPARPNWLYRGYTGHEMLDPFVLINMNGRIYDPVVGRVLSPDNLIPDPFDSQHFNRYSYALNNPLRYSDPDGNCPVCLVIGLGAAFGWFSGKINGASGWDLVGYTLGGAAVGAVSFGVGQAVLEAFPLAAQGGITAGSIGAYAASGAAAGFVGGGLNAAIQGGDFWTGAWQGAVFGGGDGSVLGFIAAQCFCELDV